MHSCLPDVPEESVDVPVATARKGRRGIALTRKAALVPGLPDIPEESAAVPGAAVAACASASGAPGTSSASAPGTSSAGAPGTSSTALPTSAQVERAHRGSYKKRRAAFVPGLPDIPEESAAAPGAADAACASATLPTSTQVEHVHRGSHKKRRAASVPGLPDIPEESAAVPGAADAACASAAGAPGTSSAGAPGTSSTALPTSAQVEHVHRGSHKDGDGAVPPALQEVLRNLRDALEQPMDVQSGMKYLNSRRPNQTVTVSMFLDHVLGLKHGSKKESGCRHVSRTEDVIASLTGMRARTLQAVFLSLRARHGRAKVCGGAGGRPSSRVVSDCVPDSDSAPVDLPSAEILEDLDVHDIECYGGATSDAAMAPDCQSTPDRHHVHDVRSIGLRLGALVARIYAEPRLPASAFTPLVAFMDAQSPGCVGELNHGTDFFTGLGRCMAQHLQQCIALEHWAVIPALGIPSDYARVIDGYTCEGEPCQVIVHILTTPSGDLEWLLVDVAPHAVAEDVSSDGCHKILRACETRLVWTERYVVHDAGLLGSIRSS